MAAEDFARALRHLWKAIAEMEDPVEKADAVEASEFLAEELHACADTVWCLVRQAHDALADDSE